jgi:hypothetical protein
MGIALSLSADATALIVGEPFIDTCVEIGEPEIVVEEPTVVEPPPATTLADAEPEDGGEIQITRSERRVRGDEPG